MGYFSQRKKHHREDVFLRIMLIIFGLLSILLFFPSQVLPSFVLNYLFQIFAVIAAVAVFAFYVGRPGIGTIFLMFLAVVFAYTSSSANLFSNIKVPAEHHLMLTGALGKDFDISGSGMVLMRSGHLNLGADVTAPFKTVVKNFHVFTVVGVDFSELPPRVRRSAFRHLKAFVSQQDDPVIIIGDFGEPAWATPMKKFLIATDLRVLNRLAFPGKHLAFNPLAVPSFYILGFRNVGVEDLKIIPASPQPRIEARLGFY